MGAGAAGPVLGPARHPRGRRLELPAARRAPEAGAGLAAAGMSRRSPCARVRVGLGGCATLERVSARRDVVVLGSTGSIGTQALDIVRPQPGPVPGRRARRRRRQRRRCWPRRRWSSASRSSRCRRASAAQDLQLAFYAAAKAGGFSAGEHPVPKILAGPGRRDRAGPAGPATSCSTASPARSGSARRWPRSRRAGPSRWPTRSRWSPAARWSRPRLQRPDQIVPVDSEHSALAQCLRGGSPRRGAPAGADRERRAVPRAAAATSCTTSRLQQALAHPTWDMGPVVTINSATLVNKGLELIEAHLLFDIPLRPDRRRGAPAVGRALDGRVRRRLDPRPGQPAGHAAADRARPRLAGPGARRGGRAATGPRASTWEFLPLDDDAFPAVRLARAAGDAGGTAPAVYNAANEVCVAAFLAGRLPFPGIVDTLARVLDEHEVRNLSTPLPMLSMQRPGRAGAPPQLTARRGRSTA